MFEEQHPLKAGVSYNVELAVNQLWLEKPGIGVKELMEEIMKRFPPDQHGTPTKQRVKAAKISLPYERLPNQPGAPDCFDKEQFVQQQLEQRSNHRATKQFKEADRITTGLQAMGIMIDDHYRTWALGERPKAVGLPPEGTMQDGVPCEMCGRFFGSRNLVFRHLRDPESGCGTSIFADGQLLVDPPSKMKKLERKRQRYTPKKTGSTAQHAAAGSSLWIGDLPLLWTRQGGKFKRLRALLFAHSPHGVPQPWIKKVVRKAYRHKEGKQYLGYAIVVYRDEEEASSVLSELDKVEVSLASVYSEEEREKNKNDLGTLLDEPPFTLKVRRVDRSETSAIGKSCTVPPGLDPPLIDQLRPLSTEELSSDCWGNRSQTENPGPASSCSCVGGALPQTHDAALRAAVASAALPTALPPKLARLRGRAAPPALLARLLALLEGLRWPARNHRRGCSAERYLVLHTAAEGSPRAPYADLRAACRALMVWADPGFRYTAVAVTKNFVASPHVDARDRTHQYVVALGAFAPGGELVVEGEEGGGGGGGGGGRARRVLTAVETRGRVARVDGRRVHWVRTWGGGDRYSLVFYATA
ncbi:unnamed protein product, partial [Heterosigma akashiwo]